MGQLICDPILFSSEKNPLSDSFLGDLAIFMPFGKNRKESRAGGHVSDRTPLNNTKGSGLVFYVCQGSTCALVQRPDTGVLARKGMHASHRDTEMASVSFLPNFVSVYIQLFPRFFFFYISITTTVSIIL